LNFFPDFLFFEEESVTLQPKQYDYIMYRFLFVLALVVTACTGGNEAGRMLETARTMYENRQFIAAKSIIDSINTLYPREIEVRKAALQLMRMTEKGESMQNIAFCDSLLPIRTAEFEALKKGFVFEKDEAFDDKGNYIPPSMTVERNLERSYIRCGVNEDGEIYVASVYFGANPIDHTGLKFSTSGGVFAETPAIPYDGGVNYRFKDNGNTTEVVTYKGEKCKEIVNFVYALDAKERIKVEYTGGKAFSFYMTDADRKALKATYDLTLVLLEIKAIQAEKIRSGKRIQLIDSKIVNNE